jgi:hypothetical protein
MPSPRRKTTVFAVPRSTARRGLDDSIDIPLPARLGPDP